MDGRSSTVTALAVGLSGPPALVAFTRLAFHAAPPLGVSIALQAVYCSIAGFVIWTILRKERLPLASIGLRVPRWSTLVAAAGLWLVSLLLLPLALRPLRAWVAADPATGLHDLLVLPMWFRLVQAVTGGVVEEIIYRGYAVERLTTIMGKRWIAVVLASLAFGLAHAPGWGLRYALVADLPFGIVATLWYVWRRDLVANILAHDAGLITGVLALSA